MHSVSEIDQIKELTFERLPDRPDGAIIRVPRAKLAKEEARALQRLRTAAWRQQNDRRRRPTSDQVARALLVAVCASPDFLALVDSEISVVRIAVDDLVERGFRLDEIQDVMRGIRRRVSKRAKR